MKAAKLNLDLKKEIKTQLQRGVLVIISGPSGAGKDTIMNEVIKRDKNVVHMVTTTSRPKRPGEIHGRDYYFISREEFEQLIAKDAFIEWVEYRGNLYGGQKKHLEETLALGKDIIWRIDVRGVKNIKDKIKTLFPYTALVFITAISLDVLQKRLIKRGSEAGWQNWNLNMAVWETKQYKEFDYLIVNQDSKLDEAVKDLQAIIRSLRLRILENKP